MKFEELIHSIESTHLQLSAQAVKQVNYLQTIRNWLIGCYIVEFEQNGEDRAVYGKNPIPPLAHRLKQMGIIGMGQRNLYTFKEFYICYPQILQTVSAKFKSTLIGDFSNKIEVVNDELMLPIETLINTLSFSHFIELLRLDSDIKRRFYEIETVKNAWKVRELARAIDTLLFERTGLSTDKKGIKKS